MFTFDALFAVCDLHASRARRPLTDVLFPTPPGIVEWPRYYDRQGFPIPACDGVEPTLVWARMREEGDYAIIAVDELPDGSRLSTVWLGLDHGFGGSPRIFETMRFSAESEELTLVGPGVREHTVRCSPSLEFPDPFGDPGETTEQLRYTTEEEALAAHHEIVRRVRIVDGH